MEYQFYEFRTVNRTLTKHEQATVNGWSSRNNATPTGAKFVYNYGDFKHNPEKCLLDYFDMMLYHANYGCRRVMLRFPKNLVDAKALRQYDYAFESDYERSLKIEVRGEYVLIDMEENLQDGGYDEWIDCEDTLSSLTTLWTDIVNGDYRCLYIAWLHFASLALENELSDADDEDDADFEEGARDEDGNLKEPPVPANLQKMTGALSEFIQFWGISEDLITAAASDSAPTQHITFDLKKAIEALSDAEKTDYLLRFLQNEPHLAPVLTQKLEKANPSKTPQYKTPRRTVQAILDKESGVTTARLKTEKEENTAKRQLELQNMVKRADKMWEEVVTHLETKTGSNYDKATQLLKDLRELAIFKKDLPAFEQKMTAIKEKYGRSNALIGRFEKAKLV